jgi:hypothetical protein
MAKYSKEQSTIIALWVLAMQQRANPTRPIQGHTAPSSITEIVNKLGEHHSSDSILLHTHGYDRLLLGRDIEKTVTALQQEIANELKLCGVISRVYPVS